MELLQRKYMECMEMFCKDLRNLAMKIISYKKKEMIPLTNEETESYENQKVCYICEKEFSTDKKDRKIIVIVIVISEVIVITQKNLEEPLIITANQDIKYQKKFLQYFIMVLYMIVIL